jgi:thiol-disulfide isomerase/thioredoxin
LSTSRATLAIVGVVAAVTLSACAGGQGGGNGTEGSDTRYVAGDGSTQVLSGADRKPAPKIAGTDLKGKPVSLAAYKGRVVVLNFWASWCSPCRAEAQTLQALYDKHKKSGVQFLGINIKDDRTAALAFERRQKIGYPSVYDQSGEVALGFRETVPPKAIPSTIVIDAKGRVSGRIIGQATYSGLDKLITTVAATR